MLVVISKMGLGDINRGRMTRITALLVYRRLATSARRRSLDAVRTSLAYVVSARTFRASTVRAKLPWRRDEIDNRDRNRFVVLVDRLV